MPKAELDPLNLKAAQRRRDAEAEIGLMDEPAPKKVSLMSGLAALLLKRQEGADAYRKAWDESEEESKTGLAK